MGKSIKVMKRQLRALDEEKKLFNVFDEAKNDYAYKRHKRELRRIGKKVDNSCPIVSSTKFFPQMEFKGAHRQANTRTRMNLGLVSYLNKIHRTALFIVLFKGKVDCYNPIASTRNTKLPSVILEQQNVDILNRMNHRNLLKTEPTEISCKKYLNDSWELVLLPTIVKGSKHSLKVSNLLTTDYDVNLEAPPSYDEYRKSDKVSMTFYLSNVGPIGSIRIMLNEESNGKVHKQFISLCENEKQNAGYKGCRVKRIISGLLIETSEVKLNCQMQSDNQTTRKHCGTHLYPGTVSVLIEEDGSISTKFSITLKKCTLLDGHRIVIGRVVKGLETLAALDSFGSRFGVPKNTICIGDCGVLK